MSFPYNSDKASLGRNIAFGVHSNALFLFVFNVKLNVINYRKKKTIRIHCDKEDECPKWQVTENALLIFFAEIHANSQTPGDGLPTKCRLTWSGLVNFAVLDFAFIVSRLGKIRDRSLPIRLRIGDWGFEAGIGYRNRGVSWKFDPGFTAGNDLKRFRVLLKDPLEEEEEMKVAVGSPGTWSGLLLRVGQCAFAGASIGVMLSAFGFSSYTAFW